MILTRELGVPMQKTMKFHGHKNKTSVQEFKGKKVLTFANHNVPLLMSRLLVTRYLST